MCIVKGGKFPRVSERPLVAELADEMDQFEKYCNSKIFALYTLFMPVTGANVCCRKLVVTFSILLLSVSTIFQLLKFVTDGFTLQLFVELVPSTLSVFGCLLYILYLVFAADGQFKRILSDMQDEWGEERTAEENEIRNQYARSSKKFTNIVTAMLIISACGIPLVGFIPHYLDVLMSLNTTRRAELLFNGEIFVDQQQYFYYIYLIQSCTTVLVGTLVLVSDNIGIVVQQHICSMAAVLGYQLEKITEIRGEKVSSRSDYKDLLTKRMKTCIKSHQRMIQLADITAEFYDIPLTIILAANFCTLTMSLVQATDPQLTNIKIVIFTCAQFCQFFLVSYMGQLGIDSSLKISENAYNAEWDVCPANVRKSLQLVILRSTKPCLIIPRGIYVVSIKNFMSVVQSIMSFYMVLRQAQ